MAEYYGTTVEDIFNTQEERFRPEGAKGIDCVIAYDVSGDGGGQWKITVKDGACKTETVEGGAFGDFTTKLVADAETLVGVTLGKIDGTEAFTAGKVKVEGDMSMVMQLAKMFVKYTGPKKKITAADIVATMEARFRPENAEGLDVKVGYDLPGDGGGMWTAIIKDGTCKVIEGLADDLTASNIVKAKDYVDLMTGKLNPMVAFGSGRLRLTGDMELAQKLPKIFAKFVVKDESAEELIVLKKTISVDMKYSTGPVMGRFLDGLKEKKILANVCPKCGRKQLPPRETCAVCRCSVDEFVEVGPEGIATFCDVIYYASPDPLTGETRETPYGALFVLIDGCKGKETLWHTLKKDDLDDLERGDRVRPVWADKTTGSVHDILYFEKIR